MDRKRRSRARKVLRAKTCAALLLAAGCADHQPADAASSGGAGESPPAAGTAPHRDQVGGSGGSGADCTFTGTARIEPADAEISGPQQFTLAGASMLRPDCVRWSVSPSSYPIFSAEGGSRPVDFAQDTGRLGVSNLPNDVELSVRAFVAGKVVASTSVRYYNPARALDGIFSEVGVLRCPDHVEQPREQIQEVIVGSGLEVTFIAIETYVDYHGSVGVARDPGDPRRGQVSLTVDEAISAHVPETLDLEGSYHARPDGRLELRDVWLGPDVAQCGHVLEREEAVLP